MIDVILRLAVGVVVAGLFVLGTWLGHEDIAPRKVALYTLGVAIVVVILFDVRPVEDCR